MPETIKPTSDNRCYPTDSDAAALAGDGSGNRFYVAAYCETLRHPADDIPCGRPVVARMKLFCVHEHERLLAACSTDIGERGDEWGYCLPCYRHFERSHWCSLRVVEVTAA